MSGRAVFGLFRWVMLALFGLFFAVPLLAMLDFSTRRAGRQEGRSSDAWANLITNDPLREAIFTSLLLALLTVALMVMLLVPTMIWVRLRVPRASKLIEFLCLLPLTIPALVIVVGIKNVMLWVTYFVGDTPLALTFPYVILVLPFCYRSIDAALAAIDLRTLSEAARSLGASWLTVFSRIVLPNIVTGVLNGAFVSVALVLGEYTFSSLLNYTTLPVQIANIYKVDARTAVAAALATIVFTSVLLLGLSSFSSSRRTQKGSTS